MTKLLTPENVAERWGVDTLEPVWQAVDDPEKPLPFLYLGRGKPEPNRPGKRGLYRFRLGDVEAWEAAKVQARKVQRQAEEMPVLVTAGHDGIIRGVRKGRVKR